MNPVKEHGSHGSGAAGRTEDTIREVAPGVWTISAPFSRMGVPMGNRTTAIQLRDGGVWVLASTPLDGPTRGRLRELGPVTYILSGDAEHHAFLGEYKAEYPQAKLVANEAVAKADASLHFDGVFGRDAPDTRYGFEDDVQHVYFSGHRKGDVAFFHPASRSLLVQDLLFNQPPKGEFNESYDKSEQSGHVPLQEKLFQPFSALQKTLSSLLGSDKEAMQRDVKKVSSWDFDRIITCHGNIIETGGKESWNSAFSGYLE